MFSFVALDLWPLAMNGKQTKQRTLQMKKELWKEG